MNKAKPTESALCDPRAVELLTMDELIDEIQHRTTRSVVLFELPVNGSDEFMSAGLRWKGTAIEGLGLCEWGRRRLYDLGKPHDDRE